ncbi:uncharacterized protein LOC144107345 [Amblyomma americanum]
MARCFPTLLFMALLATSGVQTSDCAKLNIPPESVLQKPVQRSTLSSDNEAKESNHAGTLQGSIQSSSVSSDNDEKESGEESRPSPVSTADNVEENIVRKEAPLIRDIEEKMREGRETERNLTATRDVIRREMDGGGGTGVAEGEDRDQMEKRLRELDGHIGQLHSKNKVAEEKFRKFIGSIDSGKIHDQQQAHDRLRDISHFVDTGVIGSVKGSKVAFGGVVNLYRRIKGGIRHIFHSLLGLRQPQMTAGLNLLAGI